MSNVPPDARPGSLPADHSADAAAARRRGRRQLLAILAVCAAPVVAAFVTYYFIKPSGRTNYGELVDPQRPVGELAATRDGAPFKLGDLHGKWIFVTASGPQCDAACAERLYAIRQVRLTAGPERERVERVLLATGAMPDAALLAQHPGLIVATAPAGRVLSTLPVPEGGDRFDHVYIVDPLGNLMMRYPEHADPNRMKRDLSKLLRASRIG